MPSSSESSPVRIALVDNDSGLMSVVERRLSALRWEREILNYAPGPDHLMAMRLNALVLNPALSGLDYIERVGLTLPALAVLVVAEPVPVADRVRGLRGGADDWITKPCHPEELVARIQAVLRRRRIGDNPVDDEPVVAGELTIRPDRFDAYVADEAAGLSRKEFELLRQLAAADGRVLQREDIYQRVWGYTMVRGDRSVDVFVRKLRNKLERVSPGWVYIHTHFGVGYRFAAEHSGDAAPGGGGEPSRVGVPDTGGPSAGHTEVRLNLARIQ
jgi:DNA-binding response OmpR family regulator